MASPLVSPADMRFTVVVALEQLEEQVRDVYAIVSQIDDIVEIHDYSCTPESEAKPEEPEQTGRLVPPDGVDVEELAGLGLRDWEIALMVAAPSEAVAKHFAQELKIGPVKAKIELCRSIHGNAVSCKNASLTIFWAKSRFNVGGDSSDGGSRTKWNILDCFRREEPQD